MQQLALYKWCLALIDILIYFHSLDYIVKVMLALTCVSPVESFFSYFVSSLNRTNLQVALRLLLLTRNISGKLMRELTSFIDGYKNKSSNFRV